jgi:hypothetical protein
MGNTVILGVLIFAVIITGGIIIVSAELKKRKALKRYK